MEATPPEWVQLLDRDSGATYYFNRATGITQWEQPAVFQPLQWVVVPQQGQTGVAQVAQPMGYQGQHGWQQQQQQQQQHQYHHHLNQQQQQQQQQYQEQQRRRQQQHHQQQQQRAAVENTDMYRYHPHRSQGIQRINSGRRKDNLVRSSSNGSKYSHASSHNDSSWVEPHPSGRYARHDSEEEANTSDEDDAVPRQEGYEGYDGKDVRWWGRPNRSRTIEDLNDDDQSGGPGRFRAISSIDQESLNKLAELVHLEKRKKRQQPVAHATAAGDTADESGSFRSSGTGRRARAYTTNSIHVTSTMTDSDATEELACVCGVIHAHMVQFRQAGPIENHPRFRVFDEVEQETGEQQPRGPRPEALGRSSSSGSMNGLVANPPPLLRSSSSSSVGSNGLRSLPSHQSILAFVKDVYTKGQMEKECLIMSFAYLERLLKFTKGKLALVPNNWKAIVLSTMMLASKVYDDMSMWNVDFSRICPSFTLKRINELEICLLEAIKYDVRVTTSQYAKYYFQLRAMRKALGIRIAGGDDSRSLKKRDSAAGRQVDQASPQRPTSLPFSTTQSLSAARRRCNTLLN